MADSPIKTVWPVLANGSIGSPTLLSKAPAMYRYQLSDVSKPNAGRTEDMNMNKMRIGQAIRLDLSWKYVRTDEVSEILTAFNPEYVQVEYLDAKAGMYLTKIFYVGDRSTPMYNATSGLWEDVSFGIIQRLPDSITY